MYCEAKVNLTEHGVNILAGSEMALLFIYFKCKFSIGYIPLGSRVVGEVRRKS
jgi:hypothetical protein